jgi:hypothetical protein
MKAFIDLRVCDHSVDISPQQAGTTIIPENSTIICTKGVSERVLRNQDLIERRAEIVENNS